MRFAANEDGATSIEYAMIAGLVSIFIFGAVATVGQTMQDVFYDKLAHMFGG